jgi:hypothetical protein
LTHFMGANRPALAKGVVIGVAPEAEAQEAG